MTKWVSESVSVAPAESRGARTRRRAARGVRRARERAAATSEGLLYMNYDDAAATAAVISLWICLARLAHWRAAHPPRLRGNASAGLFMPLLTFRYARCEWRCTKCNISPGREISRPNERSHRTFGMQIRQSVVCKRTYATHAIPIGGCRRPLWDPLRRFLHYINLHFSWFICTITILA